MKVSIASDRETNIYQTFTTDEYESKYHKMIHISKQKRSWDEKRAETKRKRRENAIAQLERIIL